MLALVGPMSVIVSKRPRAAKEDVTVKLISIFKQLISEGALVAGCRLPSERELAESFGVSRSSLRQALKVLEIMGVISQRVGDGTYLNSGAGSILGEPMEFLILLDGISFHEIMEARLVVEPELAARAAIRASDEDLKELRAELSTMEQAGLDHELFVHHDLLFHQAIFKAAGNRVCGQMFAVVHKSLGKLITVTSQLVEPEHTLTLHRRIYQAIRKRDSEDARQKMIEHLIDARDLLVRAAERNDTCQLHQRISTLSTDARRRRR